MADLNLRREHNLGLARARKVALKWAEHVEKKLEMECTLIEGDTEAAPAIREPVWVSYAGNRLSIQAHNQPLSYVLAQVASKVGVPFDLRSDTDEMIDIEFNHYTLEQAMRSLPPSARFYVRNDFRGPEGKPLRIVSQKPN